MVALGDSITVGRGDGDNPECLNVDRYRSGYAPRLSAIEQLPVVNEGVCGDTSFGGRRRVASVLVRYRPSVLLLLFSPNDSPYEIGAVIDNLRFMIRVARRYDATPVVGTLPPGVGPHAGWEPFIVSLNAGIRRMAREERVAFADHHRAFTRNRQFQQNTEALLTPDGLHPNGRGYELMAQTWSRAIHEPLERSTGNQNLSVPELP